MPRRADLLSHGVTALITLAGVALGVAGTLYIQRREDVRSDQRTERAARRLVGAEMQGLDQVVNNYNQTKIAPASDELETQAWDTNSAFLAATLTEDDWRKRGRIYYKTSLPSSVSSRIRTFTNRKTISARFSEASWAN